jgi:hypothetical protein
MQDKLSERPQHTDWNMTKIAHPLRFAKSGNDIFTEPPSSIKITIMDTQNQKDPAPVKDEAVKKALASGRNANDNFQQDTEDDFGIDKSAPDADQELEERDEIKGGKGHKGTTRNRNDDFDAEPQ